MLGVDADGDGIDDGVAQNSYHDPDGIVVDTSSDLQNQIGDTSEVAFREVAVPEIGVAKEVVGDPVPQPDGTFLVTYQIVVENTGNADLSNLSVIEDLAAEFGPAFDSASNLTLFIPPTDPGSTITINTAWDGSGVTDAINNTPALTLLQAGDSFTLRFDVVVNPTNSALDNQVTATGTAVNEAGKPITDGSGSLLVATDVSDSGSDPDGTNPGEDGDTGGSDDPTPLTLPSIAVAKEVFGTPVALADGNFEVIYQLVVENTGNVDLADLSLTDDLATQFGSAFVSAGNLTLVPPTTGGSSVVVIDTSFDGSGNIEIIDQAAATLLAVGESYTVRFTVIVDPDASGTSSTLDNQACLLYTSPSPRD